jgi:hypothetical protein
MPRAGDTGPQRESRRGSEAVRLARLAGTLLAANRNLDAEGSMTLPEAKRASRRARMRRAPTELAVVLLVVALGCTAARPVLYEDAVLQERGQEAAAAAIERCMVAARQHASSDTARVVRQTATSGAIGGATGAVVGAIAGRPGTGAAMGAAGAATHALLTGILGARELDPIERNYVDRCLREEGYDPIGWR